MTERPVDPDDLRPAAPPGDREPGLRLAMASFRSTNFRWFWAGGLSSNIGRWMQNAAVPYVLYDLTGSAIVVGLFGLFRFVPSVIVGPWAGSLADRHDRRTILLSTQAALAAITLAFWLVWMLGAGTPAVLLLLTGLSGVAIGLNNPAWQAFISELVPRQDLLGAITLNSAQMNGARAFGPALAGLSLGTLGVGWTFLLTSFAFATVMVALRRIDVEVRAREPDTVTSLRHFANGLRQAWNRIELRTCLVLMVGVALLAMPLLQLLTVYATDVFDVGPSGYGLLVGALGLGGAVAAPVLSGWGSRVRLGDLLGISAIAYGFALVGFSLTTSLAAGLALVAVVGVGFLFVTSTVNTVVLLAVGESERGRMVAVFGVVFAVAYPIGSLIQGWSTGRFGAPSTTAIAGVLLAAIGVPLLVGHGLRRGLDGAR